MTPEEFKARMAAVRAFAEEMLGGDSATERGIWPDDREGRVTVHISVHRATQALFDEVVAAGGTVQEPEADRPYPSKYARVEAGDVALGVFRDLPKCVVCYYAKHEGRCADRATRVATDTTAKPSAEEADDVGF